MRSSDAAEGGPFRPVKKGERRGAGGEEGAGGWLGESWEEIGGWEQLTPAMRIILRQMAAQKVGLGGRER